MTVSLTSNVSNDLFRGYIATQSNPDGIYSDQVAEHIVASLHQSADGQNPLLVRNILSNAINLGTFFSSQIANYEAPFGFFRSIQGASRTSHFIENTIKTAGTIGRFDYESEYKSPKATIERIAFSVFTYATSLTFNKLKMQDISSTVPQYLASLYRGNATAFSSLKAQVFRDILNSCGVDKDGVPASKEVTSSFFEEIGQPSPMTTAHIDGMVDYMTETGKIASTDATFVLFLSPYQYRHLVRTAPDKLLSRDYTDFPLGHNPSLRPKITQYNNVIIYPLSYLYADMSQQDTHDAYSGLPFVSTTGAETETSIMFDLTLAPEERPFVSAMSSETLEHAYGSNDVGNGRARSDTYIWTGGGTCVDPTKVLRVTLPSAQTRLTKVATPEYIGDQNIEDLSVLPA